MSLKTDKVCANTHTVADLYRRLGLLHECLEEVLFHRRVAGSVFSLRDSLALCAKEAGNQEDAQAILQWGEEVWGNFTEHNLVEEMVSLKNELLTLPILTVYVPVQFTPDAEAVLGVWCKEHIGKNLMLELLIDPNVTGGCAFVSHDTFHDYSLKRAFDSNKGIVAELLSSYA